MIEKENVFDWLQTWYKSIVSFLIDLEYCCEQKRFLVVAKMVL